MALTDYKVSTADVNANAVHVAVSGDRLSGTVLQNKEVFDKFPAIIAQRHNELIDNYLAINLPDGDAGLDYSNSEIGYICTALDCTEADVTL